MDKLPTEFNTYLDRAKKNDSIRNHFGDNTERMNEFCEKRASILYNYEKELVKLKEQYGNYKDMFELGEIARERSLTLDDILEDIEYPKRREKLKSNAEDSLYELNAQYGFVDEKLEARVKERHKKANYSKKSDTTTNSYDEARKNFDESMAALRLCMKESDDEIEKILGKLGKKTQHKYNDDCDDYKKRKEVGEGDMEEISNKRTIIANLIKNTDILEAQFESCGLRLSSFGYDISNGDINKAQLEALLEIVSTGEKTFTKDDDFEIHVNLYDEEGRICAKSSGFIYGSVFKGIWSDKCTFYSEGIVLLAQKVRIYIT